METEYFNITLPKIEINKYNEFVEIIRQQLYTFSTKNDILTSEIIRNDTYLYNVFKRKIYLILSEYKKQYPENDLRIFESFRSSLRQHYLYQAGATTVLNNGMHYFGIAVDLVFIENGKWTWNKNYSEVWNIAKKYELKPVKTSDLCHFQHIEVNQQNYLRDLYKHIVYYFQKEYGLVCDCVIGAKTLGQFKVNFYRFNEIFNKIVNYLCS